jgi:hypothetical protein
LRQEGRCLLLLVPTSAKFLHLVEAELSSFNMHSLTPLSAMNCDFRERVGAGTRTERYRESVTTDRKKKRRGRHKRNIRATFIQNRLKG